MEIILAPTIIFMVFIAPIWLVLHYRFKSKMAQGISEQEVTDVEDMLDTIDKLIERVETLEDILDEEHPNWRKSRRKRD